MERDPVVLKECHAFVHYFTTFD